MTHAPGPELDELVCDAIGHGCCDNSGTPAYLPVSQDMGYAYAHCVPWLRGKGCIVSVEDWQKHIFGFAAVATVHRGQPAIKARGDTWPHALALLVLAVVESEVKYG